MYVCFMRFSTIFTVRSLKSLFELLRSLLLKSLKSGPLRAQFCQFAQSAPLFALRSAIALKMKVRSRAKSERAISKSDVPSSGKRGPCHEISDCCFFIKELLLVPIEALGDGFDFYQIFTLIFNKNLAQRCMIHCLGHCTGAWGR